jgi:hypothetical protein
VINIENLELCGGYIVVAVLVKQAIIVKIVKYESPINTAVSKPSAEKPEHVIPRILAAGNPKTSPIMYPWLTHPFILLIQPGVLHLIL